MELFNKFTWYFNYYNYFILHYIGASKNKSMAINTGFSYIFYICFNCFKNIKYVGTHSIKLCFKRNFIIGSLLPVMIVVLFQPEIRKFMGSLGRRKIFGESFEFFTGSEVNPIKIIDEIVKAIKYLSLNKIGALIVIKRKDNLNEVIETGIPINSDVTSELISTIFYPNSPLHDGAVVIEEDKIVAARCLLPLSENEALEKELGTRHRAGVGITEVTDAISIIVSEETGIISIAIEGKITRYLSVLELRGMLILLLKKEKGGKVKVGQK